MVDWKKVVNVYRSEGNQEFLCRFLRYLRRKPLKYELPFRVYIYLRCSKNILQYGKNGAFHPFRIYWVSPDQIKFRGKRFERTSVGSVQAGKWDLDPAPFDELPHYMGLHQRFKQSYNWSDTVYDSFIRMKFEENGSWWGFDSYDEFSSNHYPFLDWLFEEISQNGYKPHREVSESNWGPRHERSIGRKRLIHEIGCNISRDGDLLINSGNHRLAIAKLAEIDQIPIQIVVRHEEYML